MVAALRGIGAGGGRVDDASAAGAGAPGPVVGKTSSTDSRRRSRGASSGVPHYVSVGMGGAAISTGSMFDAAAKAPIGSTAIVTTMRFFEHLFQHSPNFASYWANDAREQLLTDFGAIAFAAATATTEVWREASNTDPSPPALPPNYPFHHPTAAAVVELP